MIEICRVTIFLLSSAVALGFRLLAVVSFRLHRVFAGLAGLFKKKPRQAVTR